MLAPPSILDEIRRRAFKAPNGELGIELSDVMGFLEICANDSIAILGWEVWIVDHAFDPETKAPKPVLGQWCGLVPSHHLTSNRVIGGDAGNKRPSESWAAFVDRTIAKTRRQLSSFDAGREVDPAWVPYLRVNFTLVAEAKRVSKL